MWPRQDPAVLQAERRPPAACRPVGYRPAEGSATWPISGVEQPWVPLGLATIWSPIKTSLIMPRMGPDQPPVPASDGGRIGRATEPAAPHLGLQENGGAALVGREPR